MGKTPAAWVFAAFLAALALAVYWPVSGYPFVHFDDVLYVTQNAVVQRGLTFGGLRTVFTTPSPGGWPHPLALVSHMLDCQLYGLHAGGHHMTNVVLHIAAAILLFLALLGMTDDPWRSSFVAAVFAVHPLQVESVAWVAERKNVLNGFLFMATLWLYARYAKDKSGRNYALMFGVFILSLLARSVMVSLPVILLLLDFWPLKRAEPWKRLIAEKLPLLALSAACSVIALRTAVAVSSFAAIPFSARLANAGVSMLGYVRRAVWPSGLCFFYPYVRGIPLWKACAAGLGVVSVTVFSIAVAGRRPWFFVGWFWFLAALAPFSGIVQVGSQAMADRYMYLPLIGLAIIAAWGVPAKVNEQLKTCGAAAAVVALMIVTSLQVRYWQDGVSLFMRALMFHPESAAVHENLGAAFYEQGDVDDAISEYRAGIAIDPRPPEAHNNLAIALIVQNEFVEAEQELLIALQADPSSEKARHNLEKVRRIIATAKVIPRQQFRRAP